ncbi:hypothetical protein MHU86_15371 [Fragilaria crotonensis]|nr:hypothetical protein MHU86_15371 [Fragilaria crotonensis]
MSSPTTKTVSSQKVINNRLKNGQCIHCGIQTHKIVKKMLQKNQMIPLVIPGAVEHGRCMLASCQKAGNNVTLETSNKPNRIAGVAGAAGTAVSVTGAVLSGLGVPGGELLRIAGAAVSESSSSKPHRNSIAASQQHYQQVMQAHQQQTEQIMQTYQQQLQAIQTTSLSQHHQNSISASQEPFQQIMQTYQQQLQAIQTTSLSQHHQNSISASQEPFQQIMQTYQQQTEQIMQTYQQQLQASQTTSSSQHHQNSTSASQQQSQQIMQCYQQQLRAFQTLPKPGLVYPFGITANIQCPNHHNCQPSPVTNNCDCCGGASGITISMMGCRQCNYDICLPCQTTATTRDAGQTANVQCPNHHNCQPSPDTNNCDCCGGASGTTISMMGCRQCNYDICLPCQTMATMRDAGQTANVQCPNHHNCQPSPVTHTCDCCGGASGMTFSMMGCRQCSFDICLPCQTMAAMGDAGQTCPSNHKAYLLLNVIWTGFYCSYCFRVAPHGSYVYYCQLCDWGTCTDKDSCRQCGIRTPSMKCPSGHDAALAQVQSQSNFVCDLCKDNLPPGTEMYCCHGCPGHWSVCVKHRLE